MEEVTDYVNGFVYESDYTEALPELKFFNFSEGRVVNEGGFDYEYFLKDHLGNVRASFRAIFELSGEYIAELNQVDLYFPFGMRESRYILGDENKELYNGKELVDNHNLFWYHYGVRYYDPQLGRWHAMDPADEFNSPYVYVGNNPSVFIDPDGAFMTVFKNENDQVLHEVKDGIDATVIIKNGLQADFLEAVNGGSSILHNIYENRELTLSLFNNFAKEGQYMAFTRNEFGNLRNVSFGKRLNPTVVQVGINGILTMGVGGYFDTGIILDRHNNINFYLETGLAYGYDASAGFNIATHYSYTYNSKFSNKDIRGWSGLNNFGLGIPYSPLGIDFGYGGDIQKWDQQGVNYSSSFIGMSIGVPIGISHTWGHTWITGD